MEHEEVIEYLKWVISSVRGYTSGAFHQKYPNIILTENGMMRMGTCLGFLATCGEETASKLIPGFVRSLDYLNNSELIKREKWGYERKVPVRIACLADDGCPFSFSFVLKTICKSSKEEEAREESKYEITKHGDFYYAYWMNGGIIFHGAGQNFTVSLDNCSGWSIHT